MVKKRQVSQNFEKSLKELEDLVKKMEKGDLSLEASLEHFERGVKLSRACQEALKAAEQKVEILMNKNGKDDISTFDSEES
jgi:exodeoxyribonuclease VII small subunit